ncbi:uncharacterized protein BcabD6B2_25230 [Babesia caballi]|uniref:Uncharacterized protein n=1 Tax=Babesia caballi TaxID=5871 RepID=A0AAV4LSG6_BABCB|nr:hypothetical protein, conserved [Babesia caballi]
MDRYRECERVLKVAAAQQCKEQGNLIKQDFATIAVSVSNRIAPVRDARELIRRFFPQGGAVDHRVLAQSCDILLDTLSVIERRARRAPIEKLTRGYEKRTLSDVAGLVRGRKFQEGDIRLSLCHLLGNADVGNASRGDGACIFNEFDDGFYELNVVGSRDVAEPSSRGQRTSDLTEALDVYTKSVKSRYVSQGLTILSDDGDARRKGAGDAHAEVDSPAPPKNTNIQRLFGVSGQMVPETAANVFEPYYEPVTPLPASKRENGVTHYVGGMYPPLHTYYAKSSADREGRFAILSQNSLRRVSCERQPQLADRLLKQSKNFKGAATPFALLARAKEGSSYTKDMVLINESALRSQATPAPAPVEYVAIIGKGVIRTFKCTTYTARIQPNIKVQQRKICSSLFTLEVEREKMLSKMLLKLLRYEYAWRSLASQWRSHIDAIAKAISNLEWGCLWRDWNFFTGGLVTEIDREHISQRLRTFRQHEMPEAATALRNVCYEFVEHLNTVKQKYVRGEIDVVEVGPQLVDWYRTKVLDAFKLCYSDVRNSIYTDLKSINNKGFPQMVAAILETKHTADESTGGDTPKMTVQLRDAGEVLQMRLELLPKHKADATDALTLTSIEDMVSKGLLEHHSWSAEPFWGLLTSSQNSDTNAKQLNLTYTAVDVCKKCSDGYKNGTFSFEKAKTAKALAVLNALVTLLKNSEKCFTGTRMLQDFLGTPYRVPEELATWAMGLFYERNAANEFFLNAKGLQKLMCHALWLCIYLAGGKFTYNFAMLRNGDFKLKRKLQSIFDICAPIAGLVSNTASKSTVYTIELPLRGIPKATTTAFSGLMGAVSSYRKRPRR